jgi:hypothetical protein
MKPLARAVCVAALAAPGFASAQSAADIQQLRDEIGALRTQYEARIKALEAKLDAAQAQAPAASTPAAVPALPPPVPVAPIAAAAPSSGNGFNPAISLILSGLYTRTSRDPSTYRIAGFAVPSNVEIGPGTRGFSLGESELSLSANIDPWFSGSANISIQPDNSVSVEEAFVQTTSLGNGFTVKAGRFKSSIGYLNSQHSHVWDFVDAPLAYQAMLGGQFADDGLQVAWLAPTDTFIELRGEIGRGLSFPGTDSSRNGAGAAALALHAGGDIGESSSWRAGTSVLDTQGDAGTPGARVWIADGVWKWAPNGNATQTNFKLQGEYLRSVRADQPTQSGWYTQAIYQFMRGWRVGVRTERLDNGGIEAWTPRKNSVMLDWGPSEFSRIRLQFAQDRARPGPVDNQLSLQYQMSLGAHGAHSF